MAGSTQTAIGKPPVGSPGKSNLEAHRFLSLATKLIAIVFVSAAAIGVLAPLVLTIVMSFKPGLLTDNEPYTWAIMQDAWTSRGTLVAARNTLAFATISSVFATALGTVMAFIAARTDARTRRLIFPVMASALLIPPYISAMSWVLLLNPRTGIANVPLQGLFHVADGPLSIYNVFGMAFVQGMEVSGIAFLLLLGVFRSMDATLGEAASMSGVRRLRVFLHVDIPLAMPALAGAFIFTYVLCVATFEVPAVIGGPAKFNTLSTLMYNITQLQTSTSGLPNYNTAAAFGLVLIVISLALIVAYRRVLSQARRFAVVTARGYQRRNIHLGRLKWPVDIGVVIVFLLKAVLPILVLLWVSFSHYLRPVDAAGFRDMTLAAYRNIFDALDAGPLRNSLYVLIVVPILDLALALGISWIVVRSRWRLRGLVDALAFVPQGVPHAQAAVAFAFLFLSVAQYVFLYESIWSMIIVQAIAGIPLATRYVNAAMIQLHDDLDDAARTSGVGLFHRFRSVYVPLLAPTLLSGGVWLALLAYQELTLPLFLAGPNTQVVSTLIWGLWSAGKLNQVAALSLMSIIFAAIVLVPVSKRIQRTEF